MLMNCKSAFTWQQVSSASDTVQMCVCVCVCVCVKKRRGLTFKGDSIGIGINTWRACHELVGKPEKLVSLSFLLCRMIPRWMIVSSLATTLTISTWAVIQIHSDSVLMAYPISFAIPLNLHTGIGWNLHRPKAPQKHHHFRARKRFLCQGSSTGLLWTGRIWIWEDCVGAKQNPNVATLYPPVESNELLLVTRAFTVFHLQKLDSGRHMKFLFASPAHSELTISKPIPSYSPPSRSFFILSPGGSPRASRRGHPPPALDPKSPLRGWCLRQCDSWPAQMVKEGNRRNRVRDG